MKAPLIEENGGRYCKKKRERDMEREILNRKSNGLVYRK